MRRSHTIALALAIALGAALAGSAQAATQPNTAALIAPIQGVLAAINHNTDYSRFLTSDALIVDEFPPFVWHGPTAASAWHRDFNTVMHQAHLTYSNGVISKPRFVIPVPRRAYVTVPTTVHYVDAKRKPQTETGEWTFVLIRTPAGWKISADTWSKTSDTGSP